MGFYPIAQSSVDQLDTQSPVHLDKQRDNCCLHLTNLFRSELLEEGHAWSRPAGHGTPHLPLASAHADPQHIIHYSTKLLFAVAQSTPHLKEGNVVVDVVLVVADLVEDEVDFVLVKVVEIVLVLDTVEDVIAEDDVVDARVVELVVEDVVADVETTVEDVDGATVLEVVVVDLDTELEVDESVELVPGEVDTGDDTTDDDVVADRVELVAVEAERVLDVDVDVDVETAEEDAVDARVDVVLFRVVKTTLVDVVRTVEERI
ncbi:hypothetical protein HDU76_005849, partial [Blyttiomyces sp. JEL0837]